MSLSEPLLDIVGLNIWNIIKRDTYRTVLYLIACSRAGYQFVKRSYDKLYITSYVNYSFLVSVCSGCLVPDL